MNWFSKSKADNPVSQRGQETRPDSKNLAQENSPPNLHHLLGDPTPHDRSLAEFYAQPLDPPVQAEALDSVREEEHKSPTSPDPEPLFDPFDGSLLGMLATPDVPQPTSEGPLGDAVAKNEDLWSHLSKVLHLQSRIAASHLEMENIGSGLDFGGGMVKSKAMRATPKRWEVNAGKSALDGEDEGVDADVEADEEEKNREREEEFAHLAYQFEERKGRIDKIMVELDDLSRALTDFHALQAPQIDLSRQNSLSTAPPSPLMASPPLRPIVPVSIPTASAPATFDTIITTTSGPPERVLGSTRMVESPRSMPDSSIRKFP